MGCVGNRSSVRAPVSLTIRTYETGELRIDGTSVANLQAGEEHQQVILTGNYRIEMVFHDGRRQRERVNIAQDTVVDMGVPPGDPGEEIMLEFTEEREFTEEDFLVGDRGPGGGFIVYDKGEYTHGWRYLEVASTDLNNGHGTPWGEAVTAAEAYQSRGMNDWRLPTLDELQIIYQHRELLENSAPVHYWAVTAPDQYSAFSIDFSTGHRHRQLKYNVFRARAVRTF